MKRSAFRTLVQLEQAHLRMRHTQMIGITDFLSRQCERNDVESDTMYSGTKALHRFNDVVMLMR